MAGRPVSAGSALSMSSTPPVKKGAARMRLLVCIDDDQKSVGAISHAQAIAGALGGGVVLLHVMEAPDKGAGPLDPVDWEIRRRLAGQFLASLARKYRTPDHEIRFMVLEGRAVDQICGYAARHPDDITVFGRSEGVEGLFAWRAARGLVDSDIGSILMVPSEAFATTPVRYACVFVSLDGSSIAESVIPTAAAIANAQNARLVVCLVVPDAPSISIGLRDRELEDLHVRVAERAKKVGGEYLDRIKGMLKGRGPKTTAMMIVEGDARQSLLGAIREEGGDLLVMASHGQGMNPDLPSGHVASFILDNADIPVLMVRPRRRPGDAHVSSDPVSRGTRPPSNAAT